MTPAHHLGLLAVLVAVAGLLVRFPRALFTEAAGEQPPRRLEWGLGAGLAVVGVAVFEALPAHWPLVRLTLALTLMVLAAVVYSDFSFLIIPDLYSVAVAALALFAPWRPPLYEALAGAAVCGGLLAILSILWRRFAAVDGLGLGDVKLAVGAGAMLGAQPGLMAISASAAAAALLAYAAQLIKRDRGAVTLVPYGAALALTTGGFVVWSVL